MPIRLIHSSGAGGPCGAGGPSPRLSFPIASSSGCGHGASKSIPHPRRKVSSVVERDRALRRHGRAVERAASVDQHLAVGELGQQRVDGIVEPELALLDEDQRGDRRDRLGHRGDAEDAVAAHRLGLATSEVPGDAELDIVAARRQPRHAPHGVLFDMSCHHVPQSRDAFVVESAHHAHPTTGGRWVDRLIAAGAGSDEADCSTTVHGALTPSPLAVRWARPDCG